MSTLQSITVSTSIMPVTRLVPTKHTVSIAQAGDSVTLKPNVPDELVKYSNLVGKFQGQVGNYAHVHFDGHGTVSIQGSYLVVV